MGDTPWRLDQIHYPDAGGAFSVQQTYDEVGNLRAVHPALAPGQTVDDPGVPFYWKLTDADQGIRIGSEQFGNDVLSTREYYRVDQSYAECSAGDGSCMPGRLRGITTDSGAELIQDTRYAYDRNGNLRQFVPDLLTGGETLSYEYDGFDRLKKATSFSNAGTIVTDYAYNPAGDITSQTGVGTYNYFPDHFTVANDPTPNIYRLDANGNQWERSGPLVAGGYQKLDYNDFDMPWRIQTGQGTAAAETRLEYETDGTRVIKRENVDGGVQQTTYIDELYERVTRDGTEPINRYRVFAGSRPVAQVTRSGSSETKVYLHDDHLGSTSAITDGDGVTLETRSFKPFGQADGTFGQAVINGFTGHEHDGEQGLINMRGRIYDPAIGRFLTADPFVTNPLSSQGWNRYAYVENNPMTFVDPSGFGGLEVDIYFHGPESVAGEESTSDGGGGPSSSGPGSDSTVTGGWGPNGDDTAGMPDGPTGATGPGCGPDCGAGRGGGPSTINNPNAFPIGTPPGGSTPPPSQTGGIVPGPWAPPGRQPIRYYIGNEAHDAIAEAYRLGHPLDLVFTNTTPLQTIAGSLGMNPAALAPFQFLKPDIFNATTGEVYEIKPAGQELVALQRVLLYQRLLTSVGLNVKLGRVGAPGTTGVVAAPGGAYVFASVFPGVISYKYVPKSSPNFGKLGRVSARVALATGIAAATIAAIILAPEVLVLVPAAL
jgi:RHS repeat-associated protein